jgi:hypothetical protein
MCFKTAALPEDFGCTRLQTGLDRHIKKNPGMSQGRIGEESHKGKALKRLRLETSSLYLSSLQPGHSFRVVERLQEIIGHADERPTI